MNTFKVLVHIEILVDASNEQQAKNIAEAMFASVKEPDNACQMSVFIEAEPVTETV